MVTSCLAVLIGLSGEGSDDGVITNVVWEGEELLQEENGGRWRLAHWPQRQ